MGSVDERRDNLYNSEQLWLSLQYEDIELEFEISLSDDREKGEFLRIASTHVDILTVDKRKLLYIMAIGSSIRR